MGLFCDFGNAERNHCVPKICFSNVFYKGAATFCKICKNKFILLGPTICLWDHDCVENKLLSIWKFIYMITENVTHSSV